MKEPWYKINYRRNLVDMHIDKWDEKFMTSFDSVRYVEMLKKANVTCAMVYANSHVGLCYWPTKNGEMHPGLHGRDIFGEVVKLCHEAGMDVILYYSVVFDNWASDHNSDWRMVQADGRTAREIPNVGWGGRAGLCCPNAEGYREFTEKQLKELAENYDFESVFFDMTYWPLVCYCHNCRKRYEEEVGGLMPKVVDWNDPVWSTFQQKREDWLAEFAHFATDTMKKYKPGVSVNHQCATLTKSWKIGVPDKIIDACDYAGGDFYLGLLQQSYICKLFHSVTGSYEFHTSRCTSLADHTTNKTKDEIEQQVSISTAHNGAFLFIDAIDPMGTLNQDVYDMLGEIYAKYAKYEKYLGGDMCEDVAVYMDFNSKMNFDDNGKSIVDASWNTMTHMDATVGAAKILKEAHIPYGIIAKKNLKDAIKKYKVIVMPNVLRLQEDTAELIREYVKEGGCVYASGPIDLNLLGDVFGVKKLGQTVETVTYFTPTEAGKELMPKISDQYPVAVIERQELVEVTADDATVLAKTVLPYAIPGRSEKFSSIHSNPPGIMTDNPALVERTYGKGRVIWSAATFEKMAKESQDTVSSNIIRKLADNKFTFELQAPPVVEAIAFDQPDRNSMLISFINLQDLTPVVPVHDMKLTVDLKGRECKKVLLLPEEKEIPFTVKDGKILVDLPVLNIMEMIKIDF